MKLSRRKLAVIYLCVLAAAIALFSNAPRAQTTLSFAAKELANTWTQLQTFLLGIQLNGSTSGSVTIVASPSGSTYTLTLPSGAGTANYFLCNTSTAGTLTFCPAPAGTFTAGEDLSGSSTSQEVIGMNGIPFSAAPTTSGQIYKYNSSTNKWDPGTCP